MLRTRRLKPLIRVFAVPNNDELAATLVLFILGLGKEVNEDIMVLGRVLAWVCLYLIGVTLLSMLPAGVLLNASLGNENLAMAFALLTVYVALVLILIVVSALLDSGRSFRRMYFWEFFFHARQRRDPPPFSSLELIVIVLVGFLVCNPWLAIIVWSGANFTATENVLTLLAAMATSIVLLSGLYFRVLGKYNDRNQ